MPGSANYNSIAPFYDRLCQLVFGQRVKKAQIQSLQFIPANSNILIVGGGTGWILEEIAKIHPSGLKITYVDSSSKMIELSKKRNSAFNTIEFINEPIENTSLSPHTYELVVTPFLFDNFPQSQAELIFKKLHTTLKPNGTWLYIDFYLSPESSLWQKIVMKCMYLFFRFVSNVKANHLPDMNGCFSSYKIKYAKNYAANFITMQVFQKQ